MSVNPGFGGQSFLTSQLPKIARLRGMIDAADHKIALAVDGGITPATARSVIAAGADTLIAGTSVFHTPDYAQAIAALRAGASDTPGGGASDTPGGGASGTPGGGAPATGSDGEQDTSRGGA